MRLRQPTASARAPAVPTSKVTVFEHITKLFLLFNITLTLMLTYVMLPLGSCVSQKKTLPLLTNKRNIVLI